MLFLGLSIVLLGVHHFVSDDIWSPYYRVSVEERLADGRILIRVNGSPHQSIWRSGICSRSSRSTVFPIVTSAASHWKRC